MVKQAYLIFSKVPTAGFSKTRLSPAYSPQVAAEIQAVLLQRLLTAALRLPATQVFLAYRAANATASTAFLAQLPAAVTAFPQVKASLGTAMAVALQQVRQQGYQQVVLTGSDIPGLTTAILQQAFDQLTAHSVVLGPSPDGGYYLIGSRQLDLTPILEAETAWSTDSVLKVTQNRLEQRAVTYAMLPTLGDIDTAADLKREGGDLFATSHFRL
ncbi:TIGR04282 family arsenosugar biosynthesis glycosyltransferase [Loigolactobacillus bifermentans]|uniref:Glycosyltransferase n=1 Tax=Loigolactobacillus bifermentans DSM 20003 TaxID=1423726 RepID=A0A0R1GLN3_9LACO|nr:TIGR04282 family arsenosugar biosynthesis glycosyltransferase [Loigolactobacillus bifermentans]KRK32833.1 hypothetical protein FC07_GL001577 [Loigolactobacillus bifermentans DSM 20003]QGG61538.1 DUF2064 domain-containing protein [Loigolactobacillus bifermentans]